MKDEIRRVAKATRKAMTGSEVLEKSSIIEAKVLGLQEIKKAKTVMVYVSKEGEVGTHSLIKKLLFQGKAVLVPKTDKQKRRIITGQINSFDGLAQGEFGVLEPKTPKRFPKNKVGLFIIPGLAFDHKGNRIGYGYGYWDRFLKGVATNRIVGLCFESQLVGKIVPGPEDVSVSKVVTEKRVIVCR